MTRTETVHDLRCDRGAHSFLARMRDDRVEVPCRECKRDYGAARVHHVFDVATGELVETVVTAKRNGRTIRVL